MAWHLTPTAALVQAAQCHGVAASCLIVTRAIKPAHIYLFIFKSHPLFFKHAQSYMELLKVCNVVCKFTQNLNDHLYFLHLGNQAKTGRTEILSILFSLGMF